ncbi:TetR family transcriptional regulator [Nocardia sp. R7R-8]|uniref:TetR family transcriptional regulator n=1 Tax=Nocardia sp. R7R-8 TaxID=3459304 RepID=UPI00403D750F
MADTSRARHVERRERSRRGRSAATATPATDTAVRKTSDERWAEILEVSARMFAERGYAATSLQHIADELDLLKGSLYYYIKTKDDLLYEVIRTVYWQGVADLRQHSAGPGSGMDRLRAAIDGHIRHLANNLTATTVFLHEFNQLSQARQHELSMLDYTGLIRSLIEDGQADGSIRASIDPPLASMFVLGAVNWVYRWYRPGQGSIDAVAAQFVDLFTAGIAVGDTGEVD